MTASRKTGKTGSRNPANQPTSVAQWKKNALPPLVTLPSGNAMRVKKMGLQALMRTGKMPNSLMSYAEKAVKKGKKEEVTDADMMEILQDKKKLEEIAKFMDEVVILCAAEPEVHPIPEEGVERNDEILYVDEIDEEDKNFIFQVVTGGTTDVENFREEHSRNVAALRGRENMGGSSKRSPRNRG